MFVCMSVIYLIVVVVAQKGRQLEGITSARVRRAMSEFHSGRSVIYSPANPPAIQAYSSFC